MTLLLRKKCRDCSTEYATGLQACPNCGCSKGEFVGYSVPPQTKATFGLPDDLSGGAASPSGRPGE